MLRSSGPIAAHWATSIRAQPVKQTSCFARLRQHTPSSDVDLQEGGGKFGFPVDNTIGGTPQPNPWTANWVDFFREHRLMHQVNISGNAGLQKLAKPVADNLEVRLMRPDLLLMGQG